MTQNSTFADSNNIFSVEVITIFLHNPLNLWEDLLFFQFVFHIYIHYSPNHLVPGLLNAVHLPPLIPLSDWGSRKPQKVEFSGVS